MKSIEILEAILINKSAGRFPSDTRFRLVFQTRKGICSFVVSKDVYMQLDIGMQDNLQIQNGRFAAFGRTFETVIPTMPDRSWMRPMA